MVRPPVCKYKFQLPVLLNVAYAKVAPAWFDHVRPPGSMTVESSVSQLKQVVDCEQAAPQVILANSSSGKKTRL